MPVVPIQPITTVMTEAEITGGTHMQWYTDTYNCIAVRSIVRVLACFMIIFLLQAVLTHAAEPQKDIEFPYSKAAIINTYDDVMQQVVDMRPLGAAQEERGNAKYSDVYSYMLTPNVGVIMQMNLGGTNATHVKAIGVEDGTEQTRAFIVLNCMVLMTTVTPGWSGNERGALAKKLGITSTFPAQGDSISLSRKGCDFQFANNGQYGLTLTIKPSVPKQKTTPPPAPKQQQKQKQQDTSPRSRYSPEVDSLLGEPL